MISAPSCKLFSKAIFLFLLFYFISTPAFCFIKKTTDVDALFKSLDLEKLIHQDKIRNLEAQFQNPITTTDTINDFDEFIIVDVKDDFGNRINTRFYDNQDISKVKITEPMLGTMDFIKDELPSLSLQEGFELLKTCMAEEGYIIPRKVARVVLYKTINTKEIVYDYLLKEENKSSYICKEFLYVPASGTCEEGMYTACRHTL